MAPLREPSSGFPAGRSEARRRGQSLTLQTSLPSRGSPHLRGKKHLARPANQAPGRTGRYRSQSGTSLLGFRLHALERLLKDHYAASVSGNWRVTHRFEDGEAVDVDYD